METNRSQEIRQEINNLRSQIVWFNSLISRCMMEANQLDLQIAEYTRSGLATKAKLADLEAELKDTI